MSKVTEANVVVVGGTPGGIMAAIAAAREGLRAVILDRNLHIGGLPANGLGATDIATRGATGGLFMDFVRHNRSHYVEKYGGDSDQVRDCSDGYRFEPHVAELTFEEMLSEHKDLIKVFRRTQFDALPERVRVSDGTLTGIEVVDRDSGEHLYFESNVFIDATYEGDLAAAAGVAYRLGREDAREFHEPMAGRLYKHWGGDVGNGSTGLGDNAIQSYNYRLCLSRDEDDRVPISKPENYNREEYISLIKDIREVRLTGRHGGEFHFDSIGRIVNIVPVPNEKTDANNQHLAFLSTDLPEENWPWPTSGWDWREAFAKRLRDYTLGLFWFVQNDPDLPKDYRDRCREWGLAKSEYEDNDHFPRDVYVREGRRISGEHLFTAHDSIPAADGARPPVYESSITSSHYALDSHAVRKCEPGRVHLDGFFSYPSAPYTVPYGVIVPKGIDGLLTPVPVSGTHIGFSTLRMEPCWMAMGEAAGVAAAIAVENAMKVREIPLAKLQKRLLDRGAILLYFRDASSEHPNFKALQFLALRGYLGNDEWNARLDEPASPEESGDWLDRAGHLESVQLETGTTTRGELLQQIFDSCT